MKDGRIIFSSTHFLLTLERLCQQLIEEYQDFKDTCLIAVQPKGRFLADRLFRLLEQEKVNATLQYGWVDITFYRDDFRRREKPLKASDTNINFLVENKRVILVDDVLYTGRSIQAAMTAINHYGRPMEVKLLTFIDRRFNRQLPIQPDFVGVTVDSPDKAYVKEEWQEVQGKDQVLLFPDKLTSEQIAE